MYDLVGVYHPTPRGPRDCRDCVHYYQGPDEFVTGFDRYTEPPECEEIPGMANLRSFPFKNTTCKAWVDHEQYNRPGPSGLSPRDVRQIQDRLGFRN